MTVFPSNVRYVRLFVSLCLYKFLFITWFHGVVTRVVGPAELVGSALVRGRAGGTLASGIGDSSIGRDARYYTHTMEGYVYA